MYGLGIVLILLPLRFPCIELHAHSSREELPAPSRPHKIQSVEIQPSTMVAVPSKEGFDHALKVAVTYGPPQRRQGLSVVTFDCFEEPPTPSASRRHELPAPLSQPHTSSLSDGRSEQSNGAAARYPFVALREHNHVYSETLRPAAQDAQEAQLKHSQQSDSHRTLSVWTDLELAIADLVMALLCIHPFKRRGT